MIASTKPETLQIFLLSCMLIDYSIVVHKYLHRT